MKYEQLIIRGEIGKTSNKDNILGYKSFENKKWIHGDSGFHE